MAHFIKTTLAIRVQLREQFKVSRTSIANALQYKSYSPLADEIRKAAIQAGGTEMTSSFIPSCKTVHENGAIIQTFANGVVVKLTLQDSSASLSRDGKVVRRYRQVSMNKWAGILESAQKMSLNAR